MQRRAEIIMLKLKNIKVSGNLIEADYFPEQDNRSAHVSIDIKSGKETIQIIEDYGGMYARMALNGLRRTLDEINKGGNIQSERVVMWY